MLFIVMKTFPNFLARRFLTVIKAPKLARGTGSLVSSCVNYSGKIYTSFLSLFYKFPSGTTGLNHLSPVEGTYPIFNRFVSKFKLI